MRTWKPSSRKDAASVWATGKCCERAAVLSISCCDFDLLRFSPRREQAQFLEHSTLSSLIVHYSFATLPDCAPGSRVFLCRCWALVRWLNHASPSFPLAEYSLAHMCDFAAGLGWLQIVVPTLYDSSIDWSVYIVFQKLQYLLHGA